MSFSEIAFILEDLAKWSARQQAAENSEADWNDKQNVEPYADRMTDALDGRGAVPG